MQTNYKQMYDALLKEYQKLQVELEETKKILETYTGEKVEIPLPEPTPVNQLSVDEFISLYISLFRGRTDVYTKWFHNTNTGSKGYSPQCHNEWEKGICEKPRIKCHACPNKNFKQLTPDAVKAHLQGKKPFGRDTIGIYPILEDETCYFLAVDFDGDNWQTDVTAFREVCNNKNIPIYIERSKSGNGGHAWFFFSEKIPIKLARKFANFLITHTMNSHHQLKLTSYDRLFPNQDYLPKGGLGNLIALPLQGSAVRNENSVFVDEAFKMIPNQRQLVATIEKLSIERIQEVCDDLKELGDIGKLMDPLEKTKPWEQKKLSLTLSKRDFPENVEITFANRIYVEKNGMSSRTLNEIKRLAAFSNPEFYEKLRYRLSVHKTERIIDCSLEDEHYLSIPRGCLDKLQELLDGANVTYEIKDKRFKGNAIAVAFNGKLYEEQEIAAQKLLVHETGILAATTAFGKTVIAANLIAERKVNTLILVHTGTLMNQWKRSLEQFLIFQEKIEIPKGRGRKREVSHVGQFGSGKDTLRGQVDIAMMQSLVSKENVKGLVTEYGMVIVDECHHAAAYGFEQILSKVNAKYVYGLTATPERRDGHDPIIIMQCGAIRHTVNAKDQAKKRDFDHSFVPRFTTLKKPNYIKDEDFNITKAYEVLVENEERNLRLVRDVVQSVEEGRNPIVLTRQKGHVLQLEKLMAKHTNCQIITLTGDGTNKQKRGRLERLYAIPEKEQCIIIATGNYVGEGFDYPRLDTLFLAMPISWSGILHQYAGRLHRKYEDKKEVIIYDYVDIHIQMFENMYHKRVKGYAMLGYTAKTDYQQQDEVGVLFDQLDFLPMLKKDMSDARLNITIASPILKKSRTISIMNYLIGLSLKPENMTIITRPVNDYKSTEIEIVKELLNQLTVSGFSVNLIPNAHQKFIVLDHQIVWYGSINLLAYGHTAGTMLRFVNKEVASEIVGHAEKEPVDEA